MKIENCKLKRGYTLLELLIVMTIIMIMAATAVTSYQKQRMQLRFDQSLVEVSTMIQKARNYASTSRISKNGGTPLIPEEGYGIYIDKIDQKIILFANTNADTGNFNFNQYNNDGDFTNDDFIEEEYTFGKEIILSDIYTGNKTTDAGDRATIIFRPPLADAYIGKNDDPTAIGVDSVPITTLFLGIHRKDRPDLGYHRFIRINKTAGFPEVESN